jgi:predicted Zn-dependent peptidase
MTPEALVHHAAELENGLRVIAIPQPQLHRAHVALYVRTGSRFESPRSNGLSHFLEHMLYRGTERLPSAHHVNLAFEELGGYLYASTQPDYGYFSVTLPPESLDAASALFGEVLARPAFFDIDIEKGIVKEEILEDLDDEGRQVDPDNISRSVIYPTHPLGYTICGTEELVDSFDVPTLKAHHQRHYGAESCVLVFSGDIDPHAAVALARRDFTQLHRGERVGTEAPSHAQKKPRLKLVENVSSQTELRISLRALSEHDNRRPALDMLMRVIDDGMSTRLYHRICDAQGLCYDVSAGYDGYEDDGIVDVSAGVQHQRSAKVTREVLTMFSELADHGPSDAELEKARRRQAWDTRTMLDSAEDVASFFGAGTLFGLFETPAERLQSLLRVTREEIREVARYIADPTRLNVVAVGLPDNGEDKRLADVVKGWKG